MIEQRGARRRKTEVLAARSAGPGPRRSGEWTRDDPGDPMGGVQDRASDPAGGVELGDRDGLLVSRHLEDAVRRGVEDPVAGAAMGFAELIENSSARGRLVAQDAPTRTAGELVDDLGRKALRVGRESLLEHQAAQLPV